METCIFSKFANDDDDKKEHHDDHDAIKKH
jgi:hypothetical protein